MSFVQFSRVSLAFGNRDILKNVTVNLSEGSKAALAGANGSGKSTLIKVMAGLIEPDSGERAVQKETRISYLPQSGLIHKGTTLRQEADRAFVYGYKAQNELDEIGELLSHNPPDSKQLAERHSEIATKLTESGFYRRDAYIEQVLTGLGFDRKDFDRLTDEFSGGWQMRIALAKSLLETPDILLLDEPTNYLDIEARTWLEQFLKSFKGGFLLVSHDRYFLDVTVNEVYELFNGVLHRYPGNYSHYEEVRRVELETLMARYEQQQQEIQKLEDFIRRFGYKATKAAQAQERQKMLDKLLSDKIEIPESLKKIHFSFPPAPHSGRLVLSLEHVSKTYPFTGEETQLDGNIQPVGNVQPSDFNLSNKKSGNTVLYDLNIIIENGDRLVVTGRNGAGKSTLLRILSEHDMDFEGNVKIGAGVAAGYFSQDSAESMQGKMSIIEMLEAESPLELIPKLRDMLGAFLFRGDDIYKSIDVLSGGEKSRLALLRLLLRPVNLLILDEPTNHLDIHSKDVLLEALRGFGGTVVFVSHDRGFIEKLATRVLELTPAHYRYFPGNYVYYMEQISKEAADNSDLAASNSRKNISDNKKGISDNKKGISDNKKSMENGSLSSDRAEKSAGTAEKGFLSQNTASSGMADLSWEEQKKLKAERRKLEKEEERLMNQITELEEKKAELESQLSLPSIYSDGTKSRKIQSEIENYAIQIEEATVLWEKVSSELS